MSKLKKPQLINGEHPFAQYVRILGKGKTGTRSLEKQEAYDAMRMILTGEVEDVQLGAFLMLLRVKEESHGELTGFVSAVKDHIQTPAALNVDLDWSSYAGKKRQLPWFILSCLLLAEQGIRVFMHGADGHTLGRLYTEQVLNELGLPTAATWEDAEQQLDEHSFSFMSLRELCPELQRIMDLRNQFGLRSPVHTLSRLINPLNAKHSMQSIFHPAYGESHQLAALELGQANAAVFKGEGGEIERKPEATCTVKQVINGEASEELWPRFIEGRQQQHDTLDVDLLRRCWQGDYQEEYGELAIIGTTAIALKLLGKAESQEQALKLAKEMWQQRNKKRLV